MPRLLAFPGMALACSISLFGTGGWRQGAGWPPSADLRSVDLASGKSDTLLSGQSVTAYDDFARREGSGLHDDERLMDNRRFGWRRSTGAHHPA